MSSRGSRLPCIRGHADGDRRTRTQLSCAPTVINSATSTTATPMVNRNGSRLRGVFRATAAAVPADAAASPRPIHRRRRGRHEGPGPRRRWRPAVPPERAIRSWSGRGGAGIRGHPVVASSSRSGSTLARCAPRPRSAAAPVAQPGAKGWPGSARVATLGSIPKHSTYGGHDQQVPFSRSCRPSRCPPPRAGGPRHSPTERGGQDRLRAKRPPRRAGPGSR